MGGGVIIHCNFSAKIYVTRSLWALRARLLVGGPSGLLTHYPTANTLSNPWIVPLSNFGAAVDSVLARFFGYGAAGGGAGIPYSRS